MIYFNLLFIFYGPSIRNLHKGCVHMITNTHKPQNMETKKSKNIGWKTKGVFTNSRLHYFNTCQWNSSFQKKITCNSKNIASYKVTLNTKWTNIDKLNTQHWTNIQTDRQTWKLGCSHRNDWLQLIGLYRSSSCSTLFWCSRFLVLSCSLCSIICKV